MAGRETSTETIHVLATGKQLQKIGRKAFDHGFSTLPDYILCAALKNGRTEKGIVTMTTTLGHFVHDTNAAMEDIRRNVHEHQMAASAMLKESVVKLDQWEKTNVLERVKVFETAQEAAANHVGIRNAVIDSQEEGKEVGFESELATIIYNIYIYIVNAILGLVFLFYTFFH